MPPKFDCAHNNVTKHMQKQQKLQNSFVVSAIKPQSKTH
ncbi:hypothetical protein PPAR_a0366 [Pseudoalteromonas paragorgicola KMM 3548]|nr:hypothetical protein PH505_af00650 [Pseudoalteromonas distincta]MBE3673188.1 hypothetical protein [Pseudoalteromonas distincta KMM 3548]